MKEKLSISKSHTQNYSELNVAVKRNEEDLYELFWVISKIHCGTFKKQDKETQGVSDRILLVYKRKK